MTRGDRPPSGPLLPGLLAVLVLSLGAAACSAPVPLSERELFDSANVEFEQNNLALAVEQYRELLDQHPFSEHVENARLSIARAHYLNGDHEKAIAAFNDFERLHPTSPELAFVEYTVGMCHLDQALTEDRDKSATERAMRQFERVRSRYSGSPYGTLAEYRLEQCRENLAGHELSVGDFYADNGHTEAALARYRFIMETYPATRAAVQATARLR